MSTNRKRISTDHNNNMSDLVTQVKKTVSMKTADKSDYGVDVDKILGTLTQNQRKEELSDTGSEEESKDPNEDKQEVIVPDSDSDDDEDDVDDEDDDEDEYKDVEIKEESEDEVQVLRTENRRNARRGTGSPAKKEKIEDDPEVSRYKKRIEIGDYVCIYKRAIPTGNKCQFNGGLGKIISFTTKKAKIKLDQPMMTKDRTETTQVQVEFWNCCKLEDLPKHQAEMNAGKDAMDLFWETYQRKYKKPNPPKEEHVIRTPSQTIKKAHKAKSTPKYDGPHHRLFEEVEYAPPEGIKAAFGSDKKKKAQKRSNQEHVSDTTRFTEEGKSDSTPKRKKARSTEKESPNKEIKEHLEIINANLQMVVDKLMEYQDDETVLKGVVMEIVNGMVDNKLKDIKKLKLMKVIGMKDLKKLY